MGGLALFRGRGTLVILGRKAGWVFFKGLEYLDFLPGIEGEEGEEGVPVDLKKEISTSAAFFGS